MWNCPTCPTVPHPIVSRCSKALSGLLVLAAYSAHSRDNVMPNFFIRNVAHATITELWRAEADDAAAAIMKVHTGDAEFIEQIDCDDEHDRDNFEAEEVTAAAAFAHRLDATLRDAAPAMLEALLNFTAGRDGTYVAALEAARAAIRLADGKTRFQVETNIADEWEPGMWETVDDDMVASSREPVTFDCRLDAYRALNAHFEDCRSAGISFDPIDWRVSPVAVQS